MALALLKDLALSTIVSMSLVGGAYFILDGQNDDIREGLGVLSGRTAVVETRLDGVDGRLERIESRLDRNEDRLCADTARPTRGASLPSGGNVCWIGLSVQ